MSSAVHLVVLPLRVFEPCAGGFAFQSFFSFCAVGTSVAHFTGLLCHEAPAPFQLRYKGARLRGICVCGMRSAPVLTLCLSAWHLHVCSPVQSDV